MLKGRTEDWDTVQGLQATLMFTKLLTPRRETLEPVRIQVALRISRGSLYTSKPFSSRHDNSRLYPRWLAMLAYKEHLSRCWSHCFVEAFALTWFPRWKSVPSIHLTRFKYRSSSSSNNIVDIFDKLDPWMKPPQKCRGSQLLQKPPRPTLADVQMSKWTQTQRRHNYRTIVTNQINQDETDDKFNLVFEKNASSQLKMSPEYMSKPRHRSNCVMRVLYLRQRAQR